MDPSYYAIHQQAQDIENMFRNMIDVQRHEMASLLQDEFRALIDDIRSNKKPRTIEQRVDAIQRHLIRARTKGLEIMRIDENMHLHAHCERLRREIRSFSHYQS